MTTSAAHEARPSILPSLLQVELRGFRNNLRLAAQGDTSEGEEEEEEEEEEVEEIVRRAKRESLGWRLLLG